MRTAHKTKLIRRNKQVAKACKSRIADRIRGSLYNNSIFFCGLVDVRTKIEVVRMIARVESVVPNFFNSRLYADLTEIEEELISGVGEHKLAQRYILEHHPQDLEVMRQLMLEFVNAALRTKHTAVALPKVGDNITIRGETGSAVIRTLDLSDKLGMQEFVGAAVPHRIYEIRVVENERM